MEIKFRAGRYMKPVVLSYEGDKIYIKFKYNKRLLEEVRMMAGARWHGYDTVPRKEWSVLNNARNNFQIEFLQGLNPYAHFDSAYQFPDFDRSLYEHQKDMTAFVLCRRHCILAAEMGTGKSLAAIEIMERSSFTDWWWVSSKSGLKSVELELDKWESRVIPTLLTYDSLRRKIENWTGADAPKGLIFDESSKIKNPNAKRSQAALHIAESIRTEYGYEGIIVAMSGSPAPKSPVDWWHQCEVARPGYLMEGNVHKFKNRLGLVVERESITGGVYPHLITWRDDETKCNICGESKTDILHDEMEISLRPPDTEITANISHDFVASKDEVSALYRRMRGLVLVKRKADCMDLPDKIYREIICEVPKSLSRSAKLLASTCESTIKCLTLLRELSDGFQYVDEPIGFRTCSLCDGNKRIHDPEIENEWLDCPNCNGSGEETAYNRTSKEVPCPKDAAISEILDEHEEYGRVVIYAGFTASVDRCVRLCLDDGWNVIRYDGQAKNGLYIDSNTRQSSSDINESLMCMDYSHPRYKKLRDKHEKVAFVGHPKSGGMGLTLHASPSIVYFSNSFDGEDRVQSEARGHRGGMMERGGNIIDIFNLETDRYVLDNLQKKSKLEKKSLGAIKELLNETYSENEMRVPT